MNSFSFKIVLFLFLPFSLANQTAIAQQNKIDKNANSDSDTTIIDKIKPYHEVITGKAISMEGLMTVHQIEEKYFLEINDTIFGRDIMTQVRIGVVDVFTTN